MTTPDFLPQCCDALVYLELGKTCAESDICYDKLRPMGAVYWFSLPYRLGLTPQSLIIFNCILMLFSSVLSAVYARSFIHQNHCFSSKKITIFPIVLISLVVHIIFVLPVIPISLSDAPANLLALISLWILLIQSLHKNPRSSYYLIAGILLGFSAWMRPFFLYPILLGLTLSFFMWLLKRPKKIGELLLLSALLPIGIQYYQSYQHNGNFSYLEPSTSKDWINRHLSLNATGYDTLLPSGIYYWHSSCEQDKSAKELLLNFDSLSLWCLFSGKLNFYLGSYSPYTYQPKGSSKNIISTQRDFDLLSENQQESLSHLKNTKKNMAFSLENFNEGNKKVYKLWKPILEDTGEIFQEIYLTRGETYRISMEVYTKDNDAKILYLVLSNKETSEQEIKHVALIPDQKKLSNSIEFSGNFYITNSGFYKIGILYPSFPEKSAENQIARSHGYSLNKNELYTSSPVLYKIKHSPPEYRIWSKSLLCINILFISLGVYFSGFSLRKSSPFQKFPYIFILLITAESLFIIPEQRFIITPMVFSWILCFIFIHTIIYKKYKYVGH